MTTTTMGASSGHISDVAIWNVALTDAEIDLLKDCSPLLVRQDALVFYWPHRQERVV